MDFDDSGWDTVLPPLINDIDPDEDRFYRTIYTPPVGLESVALNVASDDGIWIYINGELIGNWGGSSCYAPGCVGDVPWYCAVHENWLLLDISEHLIPGQPNVIAAHVSNYALHGDDWSYFSLNLHPDMLVFDLPIWYEGREVSNREKFYRQFQYQMTALFDHGLSGDEFLLPYNGVRLPDPQNILCQYGVNCYDGHDGWDFDDRDSLIDVFPVAEGDIITHKSGFKNDGFGYRVCVKHGNSGYSTLYAHLRGVNLVTSGHVTTANKIGEIGNTGCGDCGTHLHLGTYFNNSSPCEFGTEVDPSGWIGSYADPYEIANNLKSISLWKHAITSSTYVRSDLPATLSWQTLDTRIDIPENSYSMNYQLSMGIAPTPPQGADLIGLGQSFYLVGFDVVGNQINYLDQQLAIRMSYVMPTLSQMIPETIKIYQYRNATESWVDITTSTNLVFDDSRSERIVQINAETKRIAPFAILGKPPIENFLPLFQQ